MKLHFIANIQCKFIALLTIICASPALFAQESETPKEPAEKTTTFYAEERPGYDALKIKPQLTTSNFYVVDEDYYAQFTYDWEDSQGRKHTSKLTDRATDVNQMIRLIEEVYTNEFIPGYRLDIADYQSDSNGPGTANFDKGDRGDLIYCPYHPMNVGPYKVKGETTPPIIGATLILVELKDDYTGDYNDNLEKPWEQAFKDIKALRVITQQMHVGAGTGTANPGYLFKVNAELNKFFIISKGYNRRKDSYRLEEGTLRKMYPFYDYFEEFSPTNKPSEVVVDGYNRMMNEEQFAVNHNCSTVMEQRHDMVMSPSTTSHQSYVVSQVFFLPDLRFNGDTKNLYEYDSDGNRILSPSNWSSPEYYSYYSLDQRPYFFLNVIKAKIDEIRATPKPDDNGEVTKPVEVDLSWTSTYKNVIGTKVPEEFMVYRVVGGVIEDNPIPYSQMKITQRDTRLIPADTNGNILFKPGEGIDETTGEIPLIDDEEVLNDPETYGMAVRSESRTVQVTILEPPMTTDGRKVEYIVYGRRHMGLGIEANYSNFTFSTSNYVEGNIEGLAQSEVIGLAIDGTSVSTADLLNQKNHYKVKINLVDKNFDPTSNLTHDMITQGTEMIIKRYTDIKDDPEVEVGRIKLIDRQDLSGGTEEAHNRWESIIYFGSISDYKGGEWNTRYDYDAVTFREKQPENLAILRAETYGIPNEANQDITSITSYNKILATLYDEFSVDVSKADHPAKYTYRLEFNRAAVVKDVKTAGEGDLLISNPAVFDVLKRDLYVGYMGYSEDQIKDDINGKELLPPNEIGVAVGVRTNANIKNYEFYAINEDNTESQIIARLTRFPDGSFRCDAYDEESENYDKMETTSQGTKGNYAGKLPIPIRYKLEEGQDVSLKVNLNSGSSFTSLRTALIPLPEVNIESVSIKYDKQDETTGLHNYDVSITANASGFRDHVIHKVYLDENEGSENRAKANADYVVDGSRYGIWSLHGEDELSARKHPGMPVANTQSFNSGRKVLKDAAAESGTEHNYYYNSKDLPQGEKNPFTIYHKVRLYAQLPDKALIGSPSQSTGYVVADTEGVHGIFNTTDGTTTGVEDVEASQEDETEVYYNLQGLQVDIETAAPGIYIRLQGNRSSKILKR